MDIEQIKSLYNDALERMTLIGAEMDEATEENFDEVNTRFIEVETEVRTLNARIEDMNKVAEARAAHKPAALAPVEARGLSVTEEATYRRGGEHQFFKDLILARTDPSAMERLHRNNREVADYESRASDGVTTVAGAGGEFAPPTWLNNLYVRKLRAGRAFADQCLKMGAPTGMTVSVPSITTGSTVAVQTDNGAVDQTDQVTSSVTSATQTVAGLSQASYQLAEFSTPGIETIIYSELLAAYNQKLDSLLLNSTVTGAKGFFQVASPSAVTYTSATPTSGLLWSAIFQAKSLIESQTYTGVDFIVMNPKNWNLYISGLDANGRALALSTTGMGFDNLAHFDQGTAQGIAGNIAGIPVVADGNVVTNLGVSTNQSEVGVCVRDNLLLWESGPRFKVADPVDIGTLQHTYVLYGFAAWMFDRYPKMNGVITGTGLIPTSGW